MRVICSEDKCTGCWACYNACPKECISMKVGILGHLFPVIDTKKCINCKLCEKICPSNHPLEKDSPKHTYAAFAKQNAIYSTSTSGGAAAVLSRQILDEGGIVYGCTCKENVEITHIRVTDKSDLDKLRGSKYVQSDISFCYKQAKQDLIEGNKVLFIGTPCQIAGLKAFLRKPYDNLLTVDLICHGVPSQSYLRDHLKSKVTSDKIDNVIFREGTNDYVVVVVVVDGKPVYKSNLWKNRYGDDYINAFIDGFTYRPSCHSCQYATMSRVSDITIGDFWGIGDDFVVPHQFGLSCVLANTDKGVGYVNNISDQLNIYERTLDEAVAGNAQLRHPQGYNFKIKVFLLLQKYFGISKAYRIMTYDKRHDWYRNSIIGFLLNKSLGILNRFFC